MVTVTAAEASTLRLRIIDEDDESTVIKELKASVAKDSLSQQSTIAIGDGTALPEYYLVKCDLLGSNGEKLCNTYTSLRYTSKYEAFEDKTPDSQEFADDIVITVSGDGNQDGGFAVLAEDAKEIPVTGTKNVLTIDGNVYTFDNADQGQFQSIQTGDLLYLPGAPVDQSLIIVASVTWSGDSAVVTAQEDCTLSDFYQYLNIDTTVYARPSQQEGEQLQAVSVQYADPDGDDGDINIDIDPEDVELSTKPINWEPLSMGGKGTLSARIRSVYDIEVFGEDYYEFEASFTTKFEPYVTLTHGCSDKDVAEAIGAEELAVPVYNGPLAVPVPGLSINADVKFLSEFNLDASATCKATIESTNGFLFTTTDGYQPIRTRKSDTDLDIKGSGSISFAFSLGANVKFLDETLKAEAGAQVGVEVTGEVKPGDIVTNEPSRHACLLCLEAKAKLFADASMGLSYKITDNVKGDLAKVKLPLLNYPLDDLYCSLANEPDSIFHGQVSSGSGKCPNYMYWTTFETKNHDGDVVDGVEVTVSRNGGTHTSTVTSPGGIYCYPGKYTASATIEKNPAKAEFTVKDAPCTVTLQGKNGTVTGAVTDSRTGRPISGAVITILEGDQVITSSSSKADGSYLASIPAGSYTIRASATGYKVVNRSITIDGDQKQKTVDFSLEPEQEGTGTLFGVVTDGKTGEPISGVVIAASGNEETAASVTTGEDGSYTLALVAGSYDVSFRREGYAPQQITVIVAEDAEVEKNMVLEPIFGSLEVTVTAGDTGEPMEGASVEMEQKNGQNTFSGSTSADGVYSFASLPAGDYMLRVTAEDYAPYLEELSIPGSSQLNRSVTMQKGGTCGPTLYWKLDGGILTIYGEGEMYNYNSNSSAPWYSERTDIDTIVVESGATTIGNGAFKFTNVVTVSLPDTIETIGSTAFYDCRDLLSIKIPGSVKSIGTQAFYDCLALTTVTLADGLESIGDGAFNKCWKLTGISIPGSVETIGENAFFSCYDLEYATLHDGLVSIGESAFENCSALQAIHIPNSVTEVGRLAFKSCSNLTEATLSNQLTVISYSMFHNNNKLTSIDLPEGITEIEGRAFSSASLTSIHLPAGVTRIGEETFWNCDLTSINFPSRLEEIGDQAFHGCEELTGDLILPTSVHTIGKLAFYETSYSNVTLQGAVTSIDYKAFPPSATTISYGGTMEQFDVAMVRGHDTDVYLGLTGKTIHCTNGDIVIPSA